MYNKLSLFLLKMTYKVYVITDMLYCPQIPMLPLPIPLDFNER